MLWPESGETGRNGLLPARPDLPTWGSRRGGRRWVLPLPLARLLCWAGSGGVRWKRSLPRPRHVSLSRWRHHCALRPLRPPSQQVFLRRRPVRGGASGGSRVPQPCACRTLLRASPLFGHSASLGPGMVAEWPALQPGTCRGPSTLSPWAPLGRSLTGLCRRVGSTCSSVAHAASRLQKGCHASCVCVCIPLSPCSGGLPPTQPQRLQGISALLGVHLPTYIHG